MERGVKIKVRHVGRSRALELTGHPNRRAVCPFISLDARSASLFVALVLVPVVVKKSKLYLHQSYRLMQLIPNSLYFNLAFLVLAAAL